MSKFSNVFTVVDGIKFHSKAEARRYQQLRLLERARAIEDLVMQPRFPIVIGGVKICTYVGDFSYTDRTTGERITEDVKGAKTALYRVKKLLMRAVHKIEIHEVQA